MRARPDVQILDTAPGARDVSSMQHSHQERAYSYGWYYGTHTGGPELVRA